eukprot:TRINITY_DN310_c4_g2_i1.p1 TRINITY_DN310_c4_g2~~TRINITY_DN310_c4_g2_i1.p1  ORF type:complete len:295 (-),score=104.33 TRINITY_DN310_c4_g2_i1:106-990(-)
MANLNICIEEFGNDVISVPKNSTIDVALQALHDTHTQAVPIEDPENELGYSDVISILDIVASLINLCSSLNNLQIGKFFTQTCEEVASQTDKDPLVTVNAGDTIDFVLREHFQKGIHRVAIISEGKITKVVSQTDFIKYLLEQGLGEFGDKTIRELGLVKEWVIFVRKSQRALKAYKKLSENQVSGVAVVDETGIFLANFSAAPIRGLTAETMKRIKLPVLDFLKAQDHVISTDKQCVDDSITVNEVLSSMIENHQHRIWVVDDHKKPIGVVSLSDFCKAYVDYSSDDNDNNNN